MKRAIAAFVLVLSVLVVSTPTVSTASLADGVPHCC
jgi:hypothetical protein